MPRPRGRPPKRGLHRYALALGNPHDMAEPLWFDTDTEVRRAAQKWFRRFEKHAKKFDGEAFTRISAVCVELNNITAGDFANATKDSPLQWQVTFYPNTIARAQIWRLNLTGAT